jgi:hypothetical protein
MNAKIYESSIGMRFKYWILSLSTCVLLVTLPNFEGEVLWTVTGKGESGEKWVEGFEKYRGLEAMTVRGYSKYMREAVKLLA